MISNKFAIKNVAIFICGALLYCIITVILYRSVFYSNSIAGNKLSNSETTTREKKQHQEKEEIKQQEKEHKNPFEYFLPSKNSIKMIPIPHQDKQLSVDEMKSAQSSQCSGTTGNSVPGRPRRNENPNWPNFSPSKFDIETDFRKWKNESVEYWKSVSMNMNGEALDNEKLKMNELGFTLNNHLKPKEGHLPIWLRAYKRRTPLDMSLAAICKVDDISETILYVTIDGGDFNPILEELEKVTCVKTRIYFHPFLSDVKNLDLSKTAMDQHALTLNAHYVYGMYLLTQKLNYPYVITIEDDLEASPDFYRYHYSVYHLVYGKHATYYDSKKIFAIGAFAHGPHIDCNFLYPKIANDYNSSCGMAAVHQVIEENYFPGWGSGVTKEVFLEYWGDWKYNGYIYDYGLTQLREGSRRYTLVPCSTRVRLIANSGVNGANNGGWGVHLHHFPSWNQKPLERVIYVDRRDGVVHADVKGKVMYNKLV